MTTEAQCCRTAQQKDQQSGVSSPHAEKQRAGHLGTAEVFRKWQEARWVGLTLGPCRSEVQTQGERWTRESNATLPQARVKHFTNERYSQSPQYSCLENPHGQRSLASYSQWGRNHSLRVGHDWDLSTHTHRVTPGNQLGGVSAGTAAMLCSVSSTEPGTYQALITNRKSKC